MSEIWKAHAFREGNTRTTITFLSQFVKYRGFSLQTLLFYDYKGQNNLAKRDLNQIPPSLITKYLDRIDTNGS
jgi:fido (protein-threonine AMPylation protein)